MIQYLKYQVFVQSRVGGGDSTPRNPMLYGADRAAGVVGPYKRRPRLNRYNTSYRTEGQDANT